MDELLKQGTIDKILKTETGNLEILQQNKEKNSTLERALLRQASPREHNKNL